MHDNPAAGGNAIEEDQARKAELRARENARQLAEHKREMESAQVKMADEVKRLKQKNQAEDLQKVERPRKKRTAKKARREFGAKQVGDEITDVNL